MVGRLQAPSIKALKYCFGKLDFNKPTYIHFTKMYVFALFGVVNTYCFKNIYTCVAMIYRLIFLQENSIRFLPMIVFLKTRYKNVGPGHDSDNKYRVQNILPNPIIQSCN